MRNTISPNSYHKNTSLPWFRVALAFADGRIDDLFSKFPQNSSEVARQLGDQRLRTHISESISYEKQSPKNFFANPIKTQQILDFCNKNNIPIVDSFYQRMLNAPKKQKKNNKE